MRGGNENVEYQLQSREPLQLRVRIQEGNAFKVCRHFTDLPAPDDFACRSCLAHAKVKHRGFCSHTQEKVFTEFLLQDKPVKAAGVQSEVPGTKYMIP